MADVPGTADALSRIAAERTRSLSPVVLFVLCFSLLASDAVGVPIGAAVIAYNLVAIVVISGIAWLAWQRRLGPAVHLALTAIWLLPVGATLMSALHNGDPRLLSLVLIELVCVAIYVHTALALLSVSVALALYVPLVLRQAPELAGITLSALGTAAAFGVLLQILVRRSLLRAEHHRSVQASLAAELARRVEEVIASDCERTRLRDRVLHAQRLEAIASLAAGVAHDMNNVLAAITNYASVVRVTQPEDMALVDSIIAQAARAAELTRGVLAYSSHGQYRKQIVRLGDVLRDVAPVIERALPPSCTLTISDSAADLLVDADRVQVGQVIVNLCSNAVDAMAGGGEIVIATSRRRLAGDEARTLDLAPGAYVQLEVSDTGTGMDDATKLRIFEPFFTTKPRGAGTGLGLAMAWGVVHGHAGSIGVTSELGRGTRFTILLPEAIALAAAPIVRTAAPGLGGGTVLVVDDETAVRRGTALMLTRRGYRVLTAGDGADALAVFAEHANEIGLVILDIGMPVMGGAECFDRLRERSEVPVLVATGYAIDKTMQQLIARGASVIEKPYAAAELLGKVAALVGGWHVDAIASGAIPKHRPSEP
jgi:two-component system cell cycle sensor histidine kinase/response regulator CckA